MVFTRRPPTVTSRRRAAPVCCARAEFRRLQLVNAMPAAPLRNDLRLIIPAVYHRSAPGAHTQPLLLVAAQFRRCAITVTYRAATTGNGQPLTAPVNRCPTWRDARS